jgi:5-formyltetrahydrofolate cyclo-ligase
MRNLKLKNFGNAESEYNRLSEQMYKKVVNFEPYVKSDVIGIFVSKRASHEILTDELINHSLKMGKSVYIPRCITITRELEYIKVMNLDSETEIGTFSLREPKKSIKAGNQSDFMQKCNVIFVPGMAFDKTGNRMGYGSGYFDKFLNKFRKHNKDIVVIGLSFDFQILSNEIPHDSRDAAVDYIISPSGIQKTTPSN